MRKSAERIIPSKIHTDIERMLLARHMFAYSSIVDSVQGKNILEVGFGEGYGSYFLAQYASSVIAIDVQDELVAYAQEKYTKENLHFKRYDGRSFPFKNALFDVVVSFQVIEHIHPKDVYSYIKEIRRVLQDGGVLCITTANRLIRLSYGQTPWNKFHFREYDPDELRNLFEKFFGYVELKGVFAQKEVMKEELERLKKIKRIARLDFLNIRHHIPQWAYSVLKSVLWYTYLKKKKSAVTMNTYRKSDYFLSNQELDSCLDLFLLCRK